MARGEEKKKNFSHPNKNIHSSTPLGPSEPQPIAQLLKLHTYLPAYLSIYYAMPP